MQRERQTGMSKMWSSAKLLYGGERNFG
jgi:hypothetical protein